MLKAIRRDIAKLNTLDDRVVLMEDKIDNNSTDIVHLKQSVDQLTHSNNTTIGRLVRAEACIKRQEHEITDLKMRSMRGDIIIRTSGKTYKECRDEDTFVTIRNFIRSEPQ